MLKSIIKSNNEVPKDKPFIFHHSLWRMFVLFLISVYVVLSTKFPVNQLGHVIIRSFVFFSVPALCTHSKYNLQSPLFCIGESFNLSTLHYIVCSLFLVCTNQCFCLNFQIFFLNHSQVSFSYVKVRGISSYKFIHFFVFPSFL